jgi:DNA-binding CsgD family transcriptional regulator
MTGPVTVSERDLRTLLGIVRDDRGDLPPDGVPVSLLAELTDQIRCDSVSLVSQDPYRQEIWFAQDLPSDADDGDYMAAFWEHFWDCDPCAYGHRSGDLRSVTRVSDFCSARQLHSTAMYCDVARPLGIEHHLKMWLPAGPGQIVTLTFFRGPGPDFSERDRALLALLRPHLHQAYLDAERRRRDSGRLTPRQRELLGLVAGGHTNAQIGRRLGLSEGTVRKHLENIYSRLQVSSRTAAVTQAFPELTAR